MRLRLRRTLQQLVHWSANFVFKYSEKKVILLSSKNLNKDALDLELFLTVCPFIA